MLRMAQNRKPSAQAARPAPKPQPAAAKAKAAPPRKAAAAPAKSAPAKAPAKSHPKSATSAPVAAKAAAKPRVQNPAASKKPVKADPFAKNLKIGDNAPPFTLFDSTGKKIVLSNLRKEAERGVIVFFYPKASSAGCTKEACDFRDSLKVFESHGYKVVGISPDTAEDNGKFAAAQKLPYPLATDKGAKVARKYGAWGKVHRYHRAAAILPEQVHPIMPKDDGLWRSTFVIDKAGKIALAWTNVRADGHVGRLKKALRLA